MMIMSGFEYTTCGFIYWTISENVKKRPLKETDKIAASAASR